MKTKKNTHLFHCRELLKIHIKWCMVSRWAPQCTAASTSESLHRRSLHKT